MYVIYIIEHMGEIFSFQKKTADPGVPLPRYDPFAGIFPVETPMDPSGRTVHPRNMTNNKLIYVCSKIKLFANTFLVYKQIYVWNIYIYIINKWMWI